MNLTEFEDLLDRWGEDLSQWAPDQRQAARALLASSEDARRLLREAEELRNLLLGPRVKAPADLATRISASVADAPSTQPSPPPDETPAAGPRLRLKRRGSVGAAFLALCFVVGVVAGVVHNIPAHEADQDEWHEFIASITDMISVE